MSKLKEKDAYPKNVVKCSEKGFEESHLKAKEGFIFYYWTTKNSKIV